MKEFFFIVGFTLCSLLLNAQIKGPEQALDGPGGKSYQYETVTQLYKEYKGRGFWIYYPEGAENDSLNLVVFFHGFGAHNPMSYGQWYDHLVKKGNVVVAPHHQKSLVRPTPAGYTRNASKSIQNAIAFIESKEFNLKVNWGNPIYAGHSYGGAIASFLGMFHEKLEIPKPKALMICQPGTSIFSGASKRSYERMPTDIKMLLIVGEKDKIVKSKMARRIYRTTTHLEQRNLITHFEDERDSVKIWATHAEPCSMQEDYDNGKRNYILKLVVKYGYVNAVDYYVYWKLLDALIDCSLNNINCETAFGNTPAQRYTGTWSNGEAVKELKVEE